MVLRTESGQARETASSWWRVRSKNRYGSGSFQLRKLRSSSSRLDARPAAGWGPSPSAGGIPVPLFALLGQEEGQVLDGQGLQQPLAHDGEHGVQIGLRAQLAGELHQRAAVVVAVAVEMPVQPLLNPVADRLEQERGDQHHGHQAGVAQVLEVLFAPGCPARRRCRRKPPARTASPACRRSRGGR